MNKPVMSPGCYGSSIFYRIDAAECQSCPFKNGCENAVRVGQRSALQLVMKFDKQFSTDKSAAVSLWWSKRWKAKQDKQKDVSRLNELLSQWTTDGLNPFHLRHGTNPATKTEPILYEIFQFMIDNKAFKPKDIVEHIMTTYPIMVKSKCLAHVKLICDTLIHNDILKVEKKGVLCL